MSVLIDGDGLVAAIKGQLGMPPVRLEVLGRAGIEIGLEPDNEIEGDELEAVDGQDLPAAEAEALFAFPDVEVEGRAVRAMDTGSHRAGG